MFIIQHIDICNAENQDKEKIYENKRTKKKKKKKRYKPKTYSLSSILLFTYPKKVGSYFLFSTQKREATTNYS